MYCKECGKEIANDSKFCQECGAKQDAILKKKSHFNYSNFNVPTWVEKYYPYYIFWVILNFICLIYYNKSSAARSYLFPFVTTDLRYYDFSEFVTYTILLPIVILYVIKIYKKRKISK